MFEIQSSQCDTIVIEVVLYGVEIWGGSTSFDSWNEIKKIEILFLWRQSGIEKSRICWMIHSQNSLKT